MLADVIVVGTTWRRLYRGRVAGVLEANALSSILLMDGECDLAQVVLSWGEDVRAQLPLNRNDIFYVRAHPTKVRSARLIGALKHASRSQRLSLAPHPSLRGTRNLAFRRISSIRQAI